MPTYNKGYKDLSFDFEANPVTGDVATVVAALKSEFPGHFAEGKNAL